MPPESVGEGGGERQRETENGHTACFVQGAHGKKCWN